MRLSNKKKGKDFTGMEARELERESPEEKKDPMAADASWSAEKRWKMKIAPSLDGEDEWSAIQ